MPSLEERVQQLEDIEDIRRLKMDYAAHCDNHYDAPKIAALFTEDGVFEAGEFGVHKGRQAVHDLFDPISGRLTFALHYYMGDKIEVTGDTATGTWYFWSPRPSKGSPSSTPPPTTTSTARSTGAGTSRSRRSTSSSSRPTRTAGQDAVRRPLTAPRSGCVTTARRRPRRRAATMWIRDRSSSTARSLSGSPSTSNRSASFPSSTVPACSAMPRISAFVAVDATSAPIAPSAFDLNCSSRALNG